MVPPSLRVWARERAFCPEAGCSLPSSGLPKRKSGVSLGCGGRGTRASALSIVIPEGRGQIGGYRKGLGSPGDTGANRSLPADSAPHPSGRGCGEAGGGRGEACIKLRTPKHARSFSISCQYRAHQPGEYSVLRQALCGVGESEMKKLLGARVQPPGPSPRSQVGRPRAGEGPRDTLSTWPFFSCPQRHEQRPRVGPGARLSHALGRRGLSGPPLPAAE